MEKEINRERDEEKTQPDRNPNADTKYSSARVNVAESEESVIFEVEKVDVSSEQTAKKRFNYPLLIEEVRKRPVLYNTELPDFYSKLKKYHMWEKVAKAMNNDWEKMPKSEQKVLCKKVQNKWIGLRCAFQKNTSIKTGTYCMKLMSEIEKHKVLYDACHKDFENRKKVEKAWSEICGSMEAGWKELQASVRMRTKRNLQTQWFKIRSNITGSYITKLKLKKRKRSSSTELQKELEREVLLLSTKNIEDRNDGSSNENIDKMIVMAEDNAKEQISPNDNKSKSLDQEEEMVIETDQKFLQSMLAFFDEMDPDSRLTARIDMIQIARRSLLQTKLNDLVELSLVNKDIVQGISGMKKKLEDSKEDVAKFEDDHDLLEAEISDDCEEESSTE